MPRHFLTRTTTTWAVQWKARLALVPHPVYVMIYVYLQHMATALQTDVFTFVRDALVYELWPRKRQLLSVCMEMAIMITMMFSQNYKLAHKPLFCVASHILYPPSYILLQLALYFLLHLKMIDMDL